MESSAIGFRPANGLDVVESREKTLVSGRSTARRRVALDVSQTGASKAGCGYVADSLARTLPGLAPEVDFLFSPCFGDFFWDDRWAVDTVRVDAPNVKRLGGLASREDARRLWLSQPERWQSFLGDPDIVHSNNFFAPPAPFPSSRLVFTLHDLNFLEHPEWTTETNRVGCFTGAFHASLHADWVVSVSEASRRHFLETFPHYPEERVTVIPHASRFPVSGASHQPPGLGLVPEGRFWLSVCTIEPRKNLERALRAYRLLRESVADPGPLVLAGGAGWLMEHFSGVLDALGLRRDVVLTGYVDDNALQWLYENCFAFVYPSLWEGFGLPVLEAMSLGAPVITSNVTSLPEVAGDACLLVDPLDEGALAHTMERIVREPGLRERLAAAGSARSRLFTWERTAKLVLEVYRKCLEASPIRAVAPAGR
jgi:glycosyltransferase involved in cell wall biosynthesis